MVFTKAKTPFGGVPWPIPGTVQAEKFDEGGEGIAYHDANAGNAGGAFRPTVGVDLQACGDAGDGFDVGWTRAGEWLEYTVNVLAEGVYTLEARVASPVGGCRFHVEFGEVDRTGPLVIPNTGGWQTWQTVSKAGVALSAGLQIMRLAFDAGDDLGNLDYLRVLGNRAPTVTVTSPAEGALFTAPATISLSADASDPDGTVSKVEFYAGATKLSEDTTAPFAYSWVGVPAGDYSLSARATDDRGATPVSPSIGLRVLPARVVDFTGSPLVGAAPLTVQFTDRSVPAAAAWYWTFGDGTVSTLASPVHAYQNPGRYDVQLSVQQPSGSFASSKLDYVQVIKDQNGDRVDDDWVTAYFGTRPFNPNGDDGDGHSNADEFELGTDPVDDQSVLAVILIQVVTGKTVRLVWPATPDLAYEVQVRNLAEPDGPWLGLTTVQIACACTVSVTVPDAFQDRGFYRIAAKAGP